MINIGDATRTLNGQFQLYSNHTCGCKLFFVDGLQRTARHPLEKAINAPNKFMGSGMYPAGAYVTYEHEYILIFRKGNKREFFRKKRELRQESAYFWEERNLWFSGSVGDQRNIPADEPKGDQTGEKRLVSPGDTL